MKEIIIKISLDSDEDLTKEILQLINDHIKVVVETSDKEIKI